MALELLKGAVGFAAIALGWLWIQRAWRRTFPAEGGDEDALAGRSGCHDCSCGAPGDGASCPRGLDRRAAPPGAARGHPRAGRDNEASS